MPPRRVLVILVPHVHLLDLSGPVQTFYEAAGMGARYELSYHALTPTVRTAQGLVLSGLEPPPDPRPDDLVLVPGIDSATIDRLESVPREWLRGASVRGTIASICSGAFLLGEAGLLDGRQCTTHWKVVDRLQKTWPLAKVLRNRLFVRDGSIVTSAGVASGIDMALALVEEDHGPRLAAKVAREMVVYLRRDGSQEQASVFLEYRTHLHPAIHRVQDWLVAHPDRRASLDELAAVARLSPRHLTRLFKEATGITLKTFSNRVKIEIARDLLHSPELTVEGIAASCGFQDARQLRRLWRHQYGTTLAESRSTGSAAGTRSAAV